jgi:ribosomal-protein-alanine N-acetyltransferase
MQPPPATLSVRVRRADMSDLDDLVALEQRAFDGDRMSRAQYRRHLDSDSAQILLASAGQHAFFGNVVLFFRKRCAVARAMSRLETLAHAMRRTSPTAA